MINWSRQRAKMVREQIKARGITDERVLAAMQQLPRQRFIPPLQRWRAYQDGPVPIGARQTISQPYIVAHMTALLALTGSEHVLEIGTGSGYQAALLSLLAKDVVTLERHSSLAERARRVFAALNLDNIEVITIDGSRGWPAAAPYDAILVTAAAPKADPALLNQLAEGGRLILPVGGRGRQSLERWQTQDGKLSSETLTAVSFVPLRGTAGWQAEDWY
jgi:protein-L-isoaspartate(D-aspartate) O-methyltransferase